jgi:hypothetical protein
VWFRADVVLNFSRSVGEFSVTVRCTMNPLMVVHERVLLCLTCPIFIKYCAKLHRSFKSNVYDLRLGASLWFKGVRVSLPQSRARLVSVLLLGYLLIVGCGGDPPLHTLSGKVTLGGKSYSRLLVYFRPVEGKVNQFNLGVGETDAAGVLSLRSTAGMGLVAGKYRVSFSCMQPKNNPAAANLSPDEKPDDDRNIQMEELVPSPYDNETNADTTPLEFEVKPGTENHFEFDIPKKS